MLLSVLYAWLNQRKTDLFEEVTDEIQKKLIINHHDLFGIYDY